MFLTKLLRKRHFAKVFKKSLRDNSQVSQVALYLNLFGEQPNSYSFDLKQGQKVDLAGLDEKSLNKIFPNLEYVWHATYGNAQSTSAIDDEESKDEELSWAELYEACVSVLTKDCLYVIHSNSIVIYYRSSISWAIEESKRVLKMLPLKEKEDTTAKIQLVASDGREYYTMTSSIAKTTADLESTYNDDFIAAHEKITDFLNSRESGLILLHGEPGTGKTTYIRHLVTNNPKDYILIPNGMMPHMSAPEFVSFIMDHKNSIFILEDCEQLLQDRAYNQFNNSISTILNMSDGLLSDVFNIKFICTFNSDMDNIDAALLRKGRCYAKYEFKPLEASKVKALAEKNNLNISGDEDMTLSEIFNVDSSAEVTTDTKKKIGF